ncbi:putative LPS assembly protein LptD [Vaginella massiliensis]|uniref:putative LPS assembly protein LptD n=1 Tax=Vaginella massiliensis TaxID=1816680 RepID=UPI003751E8A4
MEYTVVRASEDEVHDRKKNITYLLRNAKVDYNDMQIEAEYIEIDWNSGDVYAEGKRDTIGNVVTRTVFTQGQNKFEQDAFKVNFKTKVGIAYNVRLEEGEGVIVGDKVKRINDTVMYLSRADYTTDTYFKEGKTDEPDYVLRTTKGKLVDKKEKDEKILIAGPTHMRIYDVPTPLALPFAYIPMGSKRSAGILLPSFGERADVGFYLDGLGYYMPIGEYADLQLETRFYTKGSWGVNVLSRYKVNYRFSGNFGASYENRITGIKGLTANSPGGVRDPRNIFSQSKLYNVRWTHAQDIKSNPYLTFNASVNFSSSQYFRESIQNSNYLSGDVYTNTTNSSISLRKSFENLPLTLNLDASHSQNYQTRQIDLTLPRLTVNMSRQFPFAPKSGPRKGLLHNLGVTYSMNMANQISTSDENFFTKTMWQDEMKTGARHLLDLSTNVTLANYFPLTISANYQEVWALNNTRKYWDANSAETITQRLNGFYRFGNFSTSASVSTNFYGQILAKNKDAKIQGIRHVLTPSIGYSFSPNTGAKYIDYYEVPQLGSSNVALQYYNYFENTLYGVPNTMVTNSLNFSLANNLELKVRDDKHPKGFKKIKIFDFFNINSSYNFTADEFKLSPVNFSGSTSLFDSKMKFNFSGIIDPYKIDYDPLTNAYTKIDELGAFRLASFNVNTGYSFDNNTFGGKKFDAKAYKKQGTVRDEVFYFDDEDYARFAIPWTFGMNLGYTHNRLIDGTNRDAATLAMTASVSPSPYWQISANGTYDIVNKELVGTRLSFARDLRSFNLTFSWIPIGVYKTWDFFIGIKASILSDAIKYDQQSSNSLYYNSGF